MKKIYCIIISIIFSVEIFGQADLFDTSFIINFEDTIELHRLYIDTISNSNNIWQIGIPQKSVFNSAYSIPNAIITDTVNPYPSNDTSSFIISHITTGMPYPSPAWIGEFFFGYKVNSDSLKDFGMIEFSPDNGKTWIDLITDAVCSYLWNVKPTLTGNSDGWKWRYIDILELKNKYNFKYGDTLLYKFTFISDSIQTNKDGLMIDDIEITDEFTNIEEFNAKAIETRVYPNPSDKTIKFEFYTKKFSSFQLSILDGLGKEITKIHIKEQKNIEVNVQNLEAGIYYYLLTSDDEHTRSYGKFVVIK